MKTKIALHLVKGDRVLFGPRKSIAKVTGAPELFESRVGNKKFHMVNIPLEITHKGKKINIQVKSHQCDYRQEFELFVPKGKPIRESLLKRIANWFGVKMKVEAT